MMNLNQNISKYSQQNTDEWQLNAAEWRLQVASWSHMSQKE